MLHTKTKECCGTSASCDSAENAGRKVRAVLDSATREVHEMTDTALTEIRTNPVQSSIIAAAAGFILGSLLRRR